MGSASDITREESNLDEVRKENLNLEVISIAFAVLAQRASKPSNIGCQRQRRGRPG